MADIGRRPRCCRGSRREQGMAQLSTLSTLRMSVIPSASHRFRELFRADVTRTLRITFRDGDIYRFSSFRIVDPSIYSISDQWNGTVLEQVAGGHPVFRQRFPSGAMIDFVESDIVEIFDETSGEKVYVA